MITTYANDVRHSTVLRVLDCCTCGVTYGMTDEFIARRRSDSRWFYCPNGHQQHYTESDADRERAKRQSVERSLEAARKIAQRERERRQEVERSRSAVQGHLTRAKRRAAAGVCQWCNRSFANVARHVAGQHPEHVEHVAP